jgi:hypothetical protein
MNPPDARRGADPPSADAVDVYELTADDWEIPEEWKPVAEPASMQFRVPPSSAPVSRPKTSVRHKA